MPNAFHRLAEKTESFSVASLPCPGWLIHGNSCRAEALLQRNVCTAVRRIISATALRLKALPDCGVALVLLRSQQAAHQSGIPGSTLVAAEALVEAWSASHPAACVQVWRLPAAFDAEQVLAAEPRSSMRPGSEKRWPLPMVPLDMPGHRPSEPVKGLRG